MISEHIRRNTCYFFFFTQADSESAYWACKLLQIGEKNIRLLSSLKPGLCVCKQAQASWSNAFLVEIDYIPPARNIGIIEYNQHDFIPALTDEEAEKVIEQLQKSVAGSNKGKANTKSKESGIETISLKLLKLWAENPFTPTVRLFERLGDFHHTVRIKISKSIELKKWAEFQEPRIGRSNMLLMELTEKGYDILQMPMPEGNKGRGKITHRHYAQWIKSHFEKKGCKAHLEWVVPGTNHPVDVGVEYDGGGIEAYEICVSAVDNLTTHAEIFEKNQNIRKITIVTGTGTELAKIKKFLKKNLLLARFKNRIELDVITNYMEGNEK